MNKNNVQFGGPPFMFTICYPDGTTSHIRAGIPDDSPVCVNVEEVSLVLSKMAPLDRVNLMAFYCRECGEANDKCACRDERIYTEEG